MPRRLRVFLSYSRPDAGIARRLFFLLPRQDYTVFFDEYCIFPGDDWELKIKSAVKGADVVLICLSRNATDRRGYLQKELRLILEEAERVPEGRSYIIPILLEECGVPSALQRWQWLRYAGGPRETDFLLQTLRRIAAHISDDDDDNEFEALVEPPEADLLGKKLVVLLHGKNLAGEPIWAYVELTLSALRELVTIMKAGAGYNPMTYGDVIAAGAGASPPDEVRTQMAENYNMVDIPPSPARPE